MLEPTTLSVRGEATLEVPADHAVLSVQVDGQDPDRELAMRTVAASADAVRDALGGTDGVRRATLSSLRVGEVLDWSGGKSQPVHVGWEAVVTGTVEVEAAAVSSAAAAAVRAGARVTWLDWRLDRDNPGPREVRRMAVAEAARAAADFADALGGTVGSLVHLADPGLLGGQGPADVPRAVALRAMAGAGGDQVDLDPQPIVLQAQVEARYVLGAG